MSSSSVSNFSLIGVRIRVLWWILQSVQKEVVEEKNEEENETLAANISSNILQIWYVDSSTSPALL